MSVHVSENGQNGEVDSAKPALQLSLTLDVSFKNVEDVQTTKYNKMILIRPRITDYHNILTCQSETDFAIPFLDEDIPLYVDPFLLWRRCVLLTAKP